MDNFFSPQNFWTKIALFFGKYCNNQVKIQKYFNNQVKIQTLT